MHGRNVAPSDTLTVRNFHFYRSEDEPEPLAKAGVSAGRRGVGRFDIIGYKFGEGNRIDVQLRDRRAECRGQGALVAGGGRRRNVPNPSIRSGMFLVP